MAIDYFAGADELLARPDTDFYFDKVAKAIHRGAHRFQQTHPRMSVRAILSADCVALHIERYPLLKEQSEEDNPYFFYCRTVLYGQLVYAKDPSHMIYQDLLRAYTEGRARDGIPA